VTDDPFAVLGVPPNAGPAELRDAFRRLALLHHPDRLPSDAEAPDRFKRVVRAYRAALRGACSNAPSPPPEGPRPDRFACAGCGDTFPFPGRCFRCEVALRDRFARTEASARSTRPLDARVEAWTRRMEARRSFTRNPELDDADSTLDGTRGERVPSPATVATTFAALAGACWGLGGPPHVALLFAGFALFVAATEAPRLLAPLRACAR
jgi:hypothetical protein